MPHSSHRTCSESWVARPLAFYFSGAALPEGKVFPHLGTSNDLPRRVLLSAENTLSSLHHYISPLDWDAKHAQNHTGGTRWRGPLLSLAMRHLQVLQKLSQSPSIGDQQVGHRVQGSFWSPTAKAGMEDIENAAIVIHWTHSGR